MRRLLGAVLLFAACGAPDGTLALRVERAQAGRYSAVALTVEKVAVYSAAPPAPSDANAPCSIGGERFASYPNIGIPIDLAESGPLAVGDFRVAGGPVAEVRLFVSGLGAVRDAAGVPMQPALSCRAPDGSAWGILRLVPDAPLALDGGATLTAAADFDAGRDLVDTPPMTTMGGVYHLHPANIDSLFLPGILLVQYHPNANEADIAALRARIGAISGNRIGRYEQLRVAGDEEAAAAALRADPSVRSASRESWTHITRNANDEAGDEYYYRKAYIDAEEAWDRATGSRAVIVAYFDTGVDLLQLDLVNNIYINEAELPPYFTAMVNGHKTADFDGDGYITYHDFNAPEDFNIWEKGTTFLKVHGVVDINDNGYYDPVDFLTPGNGIVDGIDNDGNGYIDDISGWNFSALSDANQYKGTNNPQDDQGHGTFNAALTAAVGNNNYGIPGITWAARILPLKTHNASGSGTRFAVLTAAQYAQALGAQVGNMSFAFTVTRSQGCLPTIGGACSGILRFTDDSQYDNFVGTPTSILQLEWPSEVTFALAIAVDDCSVNYDTRTFFTWPASLHRPNMITVTATDQNDQIAAFAARGSSVVDIGAPGVSMESLVNGRGSTLGYSDGTSQAAPLVAGTAALLIGAAPGLGADAADLRSRILNAADNVGINVNGGRRLNVARALDNALP